MRIRITNVVPGAEGLALGVELDIAQAEAEAWIRSGVAVAVLDVADVPPAIVEEMAQRRRPRR